MNINKKKNTQGGFLQLILTIIALVFIMWYFDLNVSGIINWLTTMFRNVLA
jgi:hypothetical protein